MTRVLNMSRERSDDASFGSTEALVQRYVEQLREGLEIWQAPSAAMTEIVGEIESHVAEGLKVGPAAGRDPDRSGSR